MDEKKPAEDTLDETTAGTLVDTPPVASNDQRVHERFRINSKTLIRLSDGSVVHAQAIDISMGGIYLEYGAPADAGTVFELAFDLSFVADFKRVVVKARVVRTVVIGSRSLYGLAFVFTEFVNDAENILGQYMELRKLKTL